MPQQRLSENGSDLNYGSLLTFAERGCPRLTLLSTNASCQLEKPENSQPKAWRSTSTRGLSLRLRNASLQTGENVPCARTCRMWRIRAREVAGAAVNRIGATSWERSTGSPEIMFSNDLSVLLQPVESAPRGVHRSELSNGEFGLSRFLRGVNRREDFGDASNGPGGKPITASP